MEIASAKLDRLSDLPDGLLLRIISLASVGSRTLVQASLLSRRWRHLWREVPRLEIDPREFQLEEAAVATTRHKKHDKRNYYLEEWDRFEKFTDNLLLRHRPDLPLDTLRVHIVNPPQGHGRRNQGDACRWVRHCLERCHPVELDVRNCFSKAVVDLRCFGRGTDLTRLTTLRLSGVVLRSGLAHYLGESGCPRLEHLELEDCCFGFTELVASHTLKTLAVSYPMPTEGLYNVNRGVT
ncbi:unnamed protein product [Alopecurus aequalis]